MGLFKTFQCPKCDYTYEGILDVCSRCGARSAPVTGIQACLDSGRPPGYAGGSNKPYSARSYDKAFERNFKVMGITNVTHKEVNGQLVPVVTRESAPGKYNSTPGWAGQQLPIRSYGSFDAMRKDGYTLPALVSEGRPFEVPKVHPEVSPGAQVGGGIPAFMRARTIIQGRSST